MSAKHAHSHGRGELARGRGGTAWREERRHLLEHGDEVLFSSLRKMNAYQTTLQNIEFGHSMYVLCVTKCSLDAIMEDDQGKKDIRPFVPIRLNG
jgi:hypothetical protein